MASVIRYAAIALTQTNESFYLRRRLKYLHRGGRVSAVRLGMAPNIYDAMNNGIVDNSWNIDYGRLHEFLCGTNQAEIGAARLLGSPPPNDSFWEMITEKSYSGDL
jgi:hypothetical protein